MSNSNSKDKSTTAAEKKVTPGRCIVGASISGTLAIAFYFLTVAIYQTFASKPIQSSNPFVINISSAVRTLVEGAMALATGICAVTTVGLVALAIQLTIQSFTKKSSSSGEN